LSFSKLNINRSLIDKTIDDSLNGATILEKKVALNNYTYKFKVPTQADASLNLYYNVDGTTTIQYQTGKNHDFSLKIAEAIKEQCSLKEFKADSFYIKKIAEVDFTTLLDFLKTECDAEVAEPTKLPHGNQYKVKGKQGDTLSFNFYNNGALQIQGKPRLLHNQTVEILSELLPFKEVIQEQLKFYETNISAGEILSELDNRLPVATSQLADKLKAIISPSLALRKIDIELTDYSAFAFPVLRGLEGVMKQIFRDKGIIVNKDGFGEYIEDKGVSIKLNKETQDRINCTKSCKVLADMYSILKTQRNFLFHVDGLVDNTRILDRNQASSLINTVLNIIEDSFVILSN